MTDFTHHNQNDLLHRMRRGSVRCELHWIMVVLAMLIPSTMITDANAADDELSIKRAQALLQGIVARRTSLGTVDAEIEVLSSHPDSKEVMAKQHYRIQQSDSRRRCEQLVDSTEPSVYITNVDTDTVYGFIRSSSASLDIFTNEYAESRRGIMDFDPRVLGMTSSMSHSSTVERCLLIHTPEMSIELLEPVQESGVEFERVKLSKGDYSSEYWIFEPKFQLARRIVTWGPDATATVVSEYDPNVAGGELPVTVTIQDRQPGNYANRIIRLQKASISEPVSDQVFSIASIGMPVNTMINDYRTNRIVGYWDGREITEEPLAGAGFSQVVELGSESKRSQTWLLLMNLILIGSLIAWYVSSKKSLNRAGHG